MDWVADADLAEWVAASCVRHGVPLKVGDALVVAEVAVLLSGGAARPDAERRRRPARTGSEPPDRVDSRSVKFGASDGSGRDDRMIEHGSNDAVLTVQVEAGPLSA